MQETTHDRLDTLTQNGVLSISVDPEHGALRFAVIMLFFAVAAVGYAIINSILPQQGFNFIAAIGGLIISAVIVQGLDNQLKARWPSGRRVEVEGRTIRTVLKDRVQREIDGSQHTNVHTWRFEITKRARAPKGWYVVALALQQDDTYIPVYTFMSPQDFERLPLRNEFEVLKPRKQSDSGDMREAGRERRLRTAEAARWHEGAEMAAEDFNAYIAYLQTHFSKWMPAN